MSVGGAAATSSPAAAEVPLIDGARRLSVDRTEFSNDYTNVDGTHTRVVSLVPLNVADGKGGFVPIDTAVRSVSGGDLTTGKHPLKPKFARKAAAGTTVSLGTSAGTVSFGLVGSRAVRPAKRGVDGVRYAGVLAGVDLDYKVGKSEVKEELVVRTRAAASNGRAGSSWDFVYRAPGLKASKTAQGSVVFKNATGAVVAAIPPGEAWDSAKKRSVVDVSYKLGRRGADTVVTVSVDRAWATSAKRVFPLHIDPTFTIPNGSSSSFASNGESCVTTTTLYCGLRVGNNWDGVRNTFWRTSAHFQYEDLFGTTIHDVDILIDDNGSGSSSRLEMPVFLHPTATVAYDGEGQGALANVGLFEKATLDGDKLHESDPLTTKIIEWVARREQGNSLFFRGREMSGSHSYKAFDAQIKIDYSPSTSVPESPNPTDGATGVSRNPTLAITYPNPTLEQRYQYIVYKPDGTVLWESDWTDKLSVPVGETLPESSLVRWRVNTRDNIHDPGGSRLANERTGTLWSFTTDNGPGDTPPEANVTGLTLRPASAAPAAVGSRLCIDATAKGLHSSSLSGVSITFSVSGANTTTSAIVTNSNGARFCYTGTRVGRDTIRATSGAASASVVRNWRTATPAERTFGFRKSSAYVGDPVNTATGNLVSEQVDVAGPAGVNGLDIVRTYNSMDGSVGVFGRGWSSVLDSTLDASDPEIVEYRAEDGRIVRFNGDGTTYSRIEDLPADLVTTSEGHALVFDDRTVSFGADGRITGWSYWDGQTVTIARADSGVTLTSDKGSASMTVALDSAGLVTSVRSGDGRQALYGYTGSALTSVTDPTGQKSTFTVDAAERITDVKDATGAVQAQNTYDDFGRIATQGSPAGTTLRFEYGTGRTTVTDTKDASQLVYRHDSMDRNLSVQDPLGKVLEKSYDAEGNLTAITDRVGAISGQTYDSRGNLLTATERDGSVRTYTYDDANRLTSDTAPSGARTSFAYTGADRLPSTVTEASGAVTTYAVTNGIIRAITDPDGVRTLYSVDELGRAIASTDGLGNTTRFTYDAMGNETSATSPAGGKTVREFDAVGRELSETDPLGATTRTAYDAAGRIVSMTDSTGAVTSWTYDNSGRPTSVSDPNGEITRYEYDALGRLTTTTAPGGAVTRSTYGTLSRVMSTTDATGAATTFSYDGNGRRVATRDALGRETKTTFDARGRVTSREDALGRKSRFEYDAQDRLVAEIDALGGVSRTVYDQDGRVIKTVDRAGAIKSRSYTAGGRLRSETDASGRTTTFTYDDAGQLLTETDPGGGVTTFTYDANGQRVTERSPGGLVTKTEYDDTGLVVAKTEPGRGTTRSQYTSRGELQSVVDATGARSEFVYDKAGRQIAATAANGATTRFTYDSRGNVVARTAPDGTVDKFAYDLANRQVSQTDALGRTHTTAYDLLGQQILVEDASGRSVASTYDAAGQLVKQTAGDGSIRSYTYDQLGRRIRSTDAEGSTEFEYDAEGRLVAQRSPLGRSVRYGYDGDGRRTSIHRPDGSSDHFSYDGDGELASVTNEGGSVAYEYDQDGHLVLETLADGRRRRRSYTDGLLTTYQEDGGTYQAGSVIERDAAGRRTKETRAGQVSVYGYDAAGQLTSYDDTTVTYDDLGRRTRSSRNGKTLSYSYDAAGQLLASSDDSKRTSTYEYDAAGRRTHVRSGHEVVTSTYDAWGQLAAVTREGGGSAAHLQALTYDAEGHLVGVDDGASQVNIDWDTAGPMMQPLTLTSAGVDTNLISGVSRAFATRSGKTGTFNYDSAGSAVQSGDRLQLSGAQRYDAFGVPQGNGSDSLVSFGYRGEMQVADLVHLRARTYDPGTGAFTTRDPLPGVAGHVTVSNPYSYAENDPLNRVDPLGLRALDENLVFARSGEHPQPSPSPGPPVPSPGTAPPSKSPPSTEPNPRPSLTPAPPTAAPTYCSVNRSQPECKPRLMGRLSARIRYALNMANLSTSIGLDLAWEEGASCRFVSRTQVHICTESKGSSVGFGTHTHTVGSVIITPLTFDDFDDAYGGRLRHHEEAHATQYSKLGPVRFGIEYGVQSYWSSRYSPSYACLNKFEVEANLMDGGYDECSRYRWYDDPSRF